MGYLGTEHELKTNKALNARGDVVAGGNLGVHAGENVNIMASSLAATDTMNIAAGKNINILSAQDNIAVAEYTRTIEAGLVAGVSQSVTTAGRNLIGMADTGVGKLGDNKGAAGTASGVQQGLNSVGNITTVAKPSVSIQLGAGLKITEKSAHSESASPVLAQLYAGNDMNIQAGKNLTIEGAQMHADNTMHLQAGQNLTVRAASGSSASKKSTSEIEAFGGVGASVGLGGIAAPSYQIAASVGGSDANSKASTYTNAGLSAGQSFIAQAGRDATFAGVNVAAKDILLDVGRNFTLASLQDEASGTSSSYKVGGKLTFGFGAAVKASGSLDLGWGKSSSDLVGRQTSIIGSNSVEVRVGENTHIKGAVLAAANNNLLLDTGSLSYEDIHTKSKNTDTKIGISGSWTFDGKSEEPKKENSSTDNKNKDKNDTQTGENGKTKQPDAQTTKDAKESSSPSELLTWEDLEKGYGKVKDANDTLQSLPAKPGEVAYTAATTQQTLFATVGGGTIIVRNDPNTSLAGLNRDPNNAISTDSSNTNLKINPLGVVDSTVGMVGIPSSIGKYWTKPFEWTVQDGQKADFDTMLKAKDPRVPKELAITLAITNALTKNEFLTTEAATLGKNAAIDLYSNQNWYPKPIGKPDGKGISAKFNYDWETINKTIKTDFKRLGSGE